MPLVPALKDLSPDELDVIQLVFNYGHMEAVLNKAKASALDTAAIVAKLLKSGYLRRE